MQFEDLFQNINVPILVYKDENTLNVIYENASAVSLLNPPADTSKDGKLNNCSVRQVLNMPDDDFQLFSELMRQNREVKEFRSKIRLPSGENISVTISANPFELSKRTFIKLCIYPQKQVIRTHAQILLAVLHAAYDGETMEYSIQNMLTCLGELIHVSRISVYEAASHTTLRNTYEWCRSDVETKMESLQMVPKYQLYNNIMDEKFVIDDDSRVFFAGDETVVGASEFQSMLSVPILSRNDSLGYMVVEGKTRYHQWSREDVALLSDFATMLAFFMTQRGEEGLLCNWSILNTVTEHLDDLMLVSDLNTSEILFANSALSKAVSIPLEDLLGKDIGQVMHKLGRSTLDDPMGCMVLRGRAVVKQNHVCEYCNATNGKWYLVRAAIIKWVDDRDVYFETMTDITEQKNNEAKLEHIASTDRMTGVHNREWGYRLIEHILGQKDSEQRATLVFLDLDHLKRVNDCYGHATGDEMIKKAVAIIQSCIRKSDSLCRWGGDEFMIIMRTREEKCREIMKKIQDRMDEYNASGESPFQIRFSYGIVEINPQTKCDMESLIAEADQRMYCNKLKRFQPQ